MRKNTVEQTERKMLDATRGIVEALHRQGAMDVEAARRFEARRTEAGAKPLKLSTARNFDEGLLTPTPELEAKAIKALREREGASQAVFAKHFGVATATLGQWERGLRRPDGPARRLLSLVERHGLDYIR